MPSRSRIERAILSVNVLLMGRNLDEEILKLNYVLGASGGSGPMSDNADTLEAIERHNVQIARRVVEYWRRQGVEIRLPGDPTKDLRFALGPNGLPRGYDGKDAIRQ